MPNSDAAPSRGLPWYWCGWAFTKHPTRDDLFTHCFLVFKREVFRAPWVYVGDVDESAGLADLEPDPDAGRDWDRDTEAMDESRRTGEDAEATKGSGS